MIDIQWKGKVGYGDIVSPICYAHNLSFKLKEQVSLTFRWDHDNQYKYSARDPETLWERADFVNEWCDKQDTNVFVNHSFSNPLNINHTSYDWDNLKSDPWHNYWSSHTPLHFSRGPLIVVNATTDNTQSLEQYGKKWKDPVAEKWSEFVALLAKRNYVYIIDYSTPILQAYAVLREAKGFIGYHGGLAWLARFTHTPSVLFTGGGKLSKQSFPYAKLIDRRERMQEVADDVDRFLDVSRTLTVAHRDAYHSSYIPASQLLNDLIHV